MKRFYIKGLCYTTEGLVMFQERNLKAVIKKVEKANITWKAIDYIKVERKRKKNYWISLIPGWCPGRMKLDYVNVRSKDRR